MEISRWNAEILKCKAIFKLLKVTHELSAKYFYYARIYNLQKFWNTSKLDYKTINTLWKCNFHIVNETFKKGYLYIHSRKVGLCVYGYFFNFCASFTRTKSKWWCAEGFCVGVSQVEKIVQMCNCISKYNITLINMQSYLHLYIKAANS